jgi:hypothetical protein
VLVIRLLEEVRRVVHRIFCEFADATSYERSNKTHGLLQLTTAGHHKREECSRTTAHRKKRAVIPRNDTHTHQGASVLTLTLDPVQNVWFSPVKKQILHRNIPHTLERSTD